MINKFALSFTSIICFVFMTGCAFSQSHVQDAEAFPRGVAVNTNKTIVPKSHVTNDGDFVIVHIVIDNNEEKIARRLLEATAMLRTKNYLRKEFASLPDNFRIPSRLLKKTYDYKTNVYYYFPLLPKSLLLSSTT